MTGTRTIVVKGTGGVKAAPDIFGVRFEVQGHEMDYADSLKTLNGRVEELRQAAELAGIDRKSVKTLSFDISVDQHYDNEKKDALKLWSNYLQKIIGEQNTDDKKQS